MRLWHLPSWLLLCACGSSSLPATPSVDVRREPSNRASLHAGLPAPSVDDARAGPSEPVAPPPEIGMCLRSRMCGFEGLCSPSEGGLCIAESDEDCDASDACLGGRCTARDGVCIAASDEDCRGSWACKGWGRCFHDGDAACSAKLATDCQASTRCQRDGECRLVGDECLK